MAKSSFEGNTMIENIPPQTKQFSNIMVDKKDIVLVHSRFSSLLSDVFTNWHI